MSLGRHKYTERAYPRQAYSSGLGKRAVAKAPPKELFPGIIDLGPPAPNTLQFGILLPLNLSAVDQTYWRNVVIGSITAIRLAVDDINAKKILPVNISLSIRSSQPPPNSPRSGSNAMMSAAIFVTSNISAIIGDTVSWLSEYSASLTSALQIPQCSFSSISDELSSRVLYNYFIRTAPSSALLVDQFLTYVQLMGWHRIGIIYTGDAFGLSVANAIVRKASEYDIVITHWEVVYLPSGHTAAFRDTMARFRDMGSLINFLLCTDADLMRALEEIQEEGMFGLPYVWITLNNVAEDIRRYFSVPGRPTPSAFNGLIMSDMAYNLIGNPKYEQFYERWSHLDPTDYPGAGPGTRLSHGEPRAYSCAWLLALGYQQDIQLARDRAIGEDQIRRELISGLYPRTTGNLSVQRFSEVSFDGPGGFIKIDATGNPEGGSFVFYQIQNSRAVLVGSSYIGKNGSVHMKLRKGAHVWPGLRTGQIPEDAPDWINQNLGWVDSIAVVFGVIAFTIMLASLIMIGVVFWRRYDPVIKASSPVFLALELLGIILTCSAIPLRFSLRSDSICVLYPMISVGGITLLLSAIVVKNVRIYKIFNNVYCNKYTISNQDLLKQAALVFLIFMIGPILYVAITQPKMLYVVVGSTDTAYMCMGHSVNSMATAQPAYVILILVPIIILLVAASFLAFRTHHVPGNWSEAKAIAYAVYNLAFAVVAYIPTVFFSDQLFRVSLIIQDIVILYGCLVCLLVLFVPKLIAMRQENKSRSRNSGLHGYENDDGRSLQGTVRAQETGGPETGLRPLDRNIAYSQDPGEAMTFEQFEDRLQANTTHHAEPKSNRRSSTRNNSTIHRRPSAALNLMLSQELHSSTVNAGPEPVRLNRLPTTAESDDGVPDITAVPHPARQGSTSALSMQYGMGVFSFGIKDEMQAVPVLVVGKHWFSRYLARWKSMRIVVITTLGLVILTDTSTGISKTFLYSNAQASSEGGHCYVYVECCNYIRLIIEFPNIVARDKWLQVFNVAELNPGHATTSSSGSTRVPPQQTQGDRLQIKERGDFSTSPQLADDDLSTSPKSNRAIKHTWPSNPAFILGNAAQHGGLALQEPPSGPPSTRSEADQHSPSPSVFHLVSRSLDFPRDPRSPSEALHTAPSLHPLDYGNPLSPNDRVE
ncbi:hypothetical protein EC968_003215 [Mortierella alpina]|nr:hypothetical protein EC968_003215 [Mortierella alpina]